ncbi:MAG: prepilin peptidase [Proteobacteria bacterium]|nr:prepilin peptidase [Pseudomonadota bacterium]MBU1059044.1 prepilin peptidase [Pseudomonadota bacterium]
MDFASFSIVTAFLFGTIIGSFLNVVILRLPREDASIVFPASHCPACLKALHWYENIPILSFLFLRGRCSHCNKKISFQYPLVELSMALFSAALVNQFGLSVTTAGYFLFCAALLVIIWIDIHHQIIPDIISLPGIIAGLLFSLISPALHWSDSLIGVLAGGGILYTIALFYYLWRRREGMGGGDIKLLAMIGAFLGWQALPFVIFASSLSGTVIGLLAMIKQKKGGQTRIPFGPFLSLAALAYIFFREQIFQLYQLYLSVSYPY